MSPRVDTNGTLKGKVAVVTGGGSGIGRSICLKFAAQGASIVVATNIAEQASGVADEIRDLGQRSLAVVTDVSDSSSVNAMADEAFAAFGQVDLLVTCAGVMGARSFIADTSDEEWRQTIDVNLNGTFYCIRAFLPGMFERDSGRVITLSSTSGKLPAAKNADYAASKHGVIGLTKALALELGILRRSGVTANSICPGSVDTPMIDAITRPMAERTSTPQDEFIQEHVASKNLQRRLLDADEIASMASFLASGEARGITGQAINVCAGTVLF